MKKASLTILRCPECNGYINIKSNAVVENGEIKEGKLCCNNCKRYLEV